jgi:hypothetical protein
MKRNRYILPLGALMAVLALGAVVMMVRASADDMLYQAAELLAGTEEGYAAGEMLLETPEKRVSGDFQMWGRRNVGPEGQPAFRLEMLKEGADEPAIAVGDGFQVWIWNPDKNTVYVGTHEELKAKKAELMEEFEPGDIERPPYDEADMPQTPEEAVDKLLEYFTAERVNVNGEDVAGTAAEKLRLVPIPEQMPEEFRANGGLLYIWLRVSDNAPLAMEYAESAVGSGKVALSQLLLAGEEKPLPDGVIDSETFSFEIPAEAEVVRLADLEPPESLTTEEASALADFDVLSPTELPAAARLAGINEVRGAIVQRYSLPDGKSFTIAQGAADAADTPGENGEIVAVRGGDGLLFSDEGGQRSLLTWSEGDVTFWVGGDLTPSDALALAESLK